MLTVRYNNTLPAWKNSTTYDMFLYYDDYTQNKIINNLTNLLDKNLYNYTEPYKTLADTGDSCKDWLSDSAPWCKESYLNGYTRKNVIVL